MCAIRIDHILTFASVHSIDDYVEQYRARGFIVSDATYRYKPGLRSRFINLGCEYIELLWVEDEGAFNAGGTEEFARMFPNLHTFRSVVRPFSIGLQTASVEDLHRAWAERGYDVPATWSFSPPGLPPVLSFQTIPNTLLPGASCFALTYHGMDSDSMRQVEIAPNTVYALEGLTLVSATPQGRATRWRDLLAPGAAVEEQEGTYRVAIGAHRNYWMTPEHYRARYGLDWVEAPHDSGEIGALNLHVSDMDQAEAMLGVRASCTRVGENEDRLLVVSPNAQDGLTFILREYPVNAWRAERTAVTGERLAVKAAE